MREVQRKGDWFPLCSGRPWYPLDPRPEEVTVEDIAHHLSNICRYTGAPRWHYPVSQHAVLVCRWLRSAGHGPLIQMQGLHHDDPEALSGFGDVVRPVKRSVPAIAEIEDNIWNVAVAPKFDLPTDLYPIVTEADLRICADEKEQVLEPALIPWKSNPEPLGVTILYWSPAEAKHQYLNEHYRLLGELAE